MRSPISWMIEQFCRKDCMSDDDVRKCWKVPIGDSIYPKGEGTKGRYVKKFNFINWVFKYKFLYPVLLIGYKLLGRHLERDVEPVWYNRNLSVLKDSWFESLDIMDKFYSRGFNKQFYSYKLPFLFGLTIALNDTATREFVNTFCHTLAKNMNLEYKGHKKVDHVFYTAKTSYSVEYFSLAKLVMGGKFSAEQIMKKQEDVRESQLDLVRKGHIPFGVNIIQTPIDLELPLRGGCWKQKFKMAVDILRGRSVNLHVRIDPTHVVDKKECVLKPVGPGV